MTLHRPPAALLEHAVSVLVVGCGGTGSAIAGGLPYLHQAMIARGHPHGLQVTLCDGDTVSPANCVRQPFSQGDVGHNKAHILASRANLFWGLRWRALPQYLTPQHPLRDYDLVIGCVDSRRARKLIADLCAAPGAGVRYWLDLGNNAEDGQYLLGQPVNAVKPADLPGRLPTAAERWPEIVDTRLPQGDQPSCSAAEAITRQAPFVNQVLANHALSLLARLFAGGIAHHGGFVNLATGRASSIPIPASPEPATPKRQRARAGAR